MRLGWFLATFVALAPLGADEFESGGVRIHYVVRGEGRPVLLLHGLGSSGRLNWEVPGVLTAVARDRRVIAIDLRGHGESGTPAGEGGYGGEMVADAVRLLDHLGIESADVVGYSMGGMIAMKLLVDHPARVRSAVLGGMGWMREGGALERFWERAGRAGGRVPEACVKGMAAFAVSEDEVKAVRAPVLVVVGSRDPVRRLYVDPLVRVRPDWRVVELDGAGHLSAITRPEFAREIAAFLGEER